MRMHTDSHTKTYAYTRYNASYYTPTREHATYNNRNDKQELPRQDGQAHIAPLTLVEDASAEYTSMGTAALYIPLAGGTPAC